MRDTSVDACRRRLLSQFLARFKIITGSAPSLDDMAATPPRY
eukprot:gene16880-2658_t